jgi:hypothetical protein
LLSARSLEPGRSQAHNDRMCVTGHAFLSALVARLRSGGADAAQSEIEALLKTGCSYTDIESAFLREDGEAFQRALDVLRRAAIL